MIELLKPKNMNMYDFVSLNISLMWYLFGVLLGNKSFDQFKKVIAFVLSYENKNLSTPRKK